MKTRFFIFAMINLLLTVVFSYIAVTFAREVDTGYYWLGGHYVLQGLLPYQDFFQFQYPPGSLIFPTITLLFTQDLMVQRTFFLLCGLLTLAVAYVRVPWSSLGQRPSRFLLFFGLTGLWALFVAHLDPVARLIQMDSKSMPAAMGLVLFAVETANLVLVGRYSHFLWLLGLVLYGSQKILNFPVIVVSLGVAFLCCYRWRPAHLNRFWFVAATLFTAGLAWLLPLLFHPRVWDQAVMAVDHSLAHHNRFSSHNALNVLTLVFALFCAQLGAAFYIWQRGKEFLRRQASSSLLWLGCLCLPLFLHAAVYIMVPRNTGTAYLGPLLSVWCLGLMVAFVLTTPVKTRWWEIVLNPLLVLIAVVALQNLVIASQRLSFLKADSHTISFNFGGREQYRAFTALTDVLRVDFPSGDRIGVLTFPQPIIAAGFAVPPNFIFGHNHLDPHAQANFLRQNHMLLLSDLDAQIREQNIKGLVLFENEYKWLLPHLSQWQLWRIRESALGVTVYEVKEKIFQPQPIARR